MTIHIRLSHIKLPQWLVLFKNQQMDYRLIAFVSTMIAVMATGYYLMQGQVVAYGDAESHLNIAKRVVHSLTPGMAQLGGVWLPLPHLLMLPFVYFDSLWRSGIAGAMVSGLSYVVSCLVIYQLIYKLTHHRLAALTGWLVFALNPNVLYLQATPMTELPLIAFFLLSTYYFVKLLLGEKELLSLISAAFFGFCATLSRYDGWFLVLAQAAGIGWWYGWRQYRKAEGWVIMFATLAFFGIALWLLWDFLILGDPLYFTNSEYSAKSQQQNWLSRGELPAYHNYFQAFAYYFWTALSNVGIVAFTLFLLGLSKFVTAAVDLKQRQFDKRNLLITLVLLVPFIFYVVTMYIGQSVVFIPYITPVSFEWRLFNVRYGVMMVPAVAIFIGFLMAKVRPTIQNFIIGLLAIQTLLFTIGYTPVITRADGTVGLSAAKKPDAEFWLAERYDGGLVILDDYARTVSIVRTKIPMQNIISVGTKPYWEESLSEPERYARWIVMQKSDVVWTTLYDDPAMQSRLFKYFNKVYTSEDILIFRRIES